MTQSQFMPQGQQFAPQQGFAPHQAVPAQAPAASYVPATDPSSWGIGTAADAGGSPVKVAHLEGRTVVVVPLKAGTSTNQQGEPSPFVQADLFILDGPTPFYFGGSPNGKPRIPDTMVVHQLPFFAEKTILFGTVLHDQLEGQIGKGIAVGRITTKTTSKGNTPWVLTTDPTAEQLQLAHQLIQAHYRERTFVNPTVQMLAGPQAQAPQQPQFTMPAMGGYAAPVAQPPQGAQFTPPAQPAFQPQFTAPAQPAPPDWTLTEILPGMPLEQLPAWQSQTTLESRLQMLAAAGITQPTNQAGNVGQPTGL